ncbi:hypothetical protein CRG98_029011 [Punica granatum]|uniref:Uncharacterized protein n=1 Tax=Punica granatum TaxID=22663 RepID=A0A2I0J311_PUNGR|nr:hypothetical protein CRG98_029011 [Punica granatum]
MVKMSDVSDTEKNPLKGNKHKKAIEKEGNSEMKDQLLAVCRHGTLESTGNVLIGCKLKAKYGSTGEGDDSGDDCRCGTGNSSGQGGRPTIHRANRTRAGKEVAADRADQPSSNLHRRVGPSMSAAAKWAIGRVIVGLSMAFEQTRKRSPMGGEMGSDIGSKGEDEAKKRTGPRHCSPRRTEQSN